MHTWFDAQLDHKSWTVSNHKGLGKLIAAFGENGFAGQPRTGGFQTLHLAYIRFHSQGKRY